MSLEVSAVEAALEDAEDAGCVSLDAVEPVAAVDDWSVLVAGARLADAGSAEESVDAVAAFWL